MGPAPLERVGDVEGGARLGGHPESLGSGGTSGRPLGVRIVGIRAAALHGSPRGIEHIPIPARRPQRGRPGDLDAHAR